MRQAIQNAGYAVVCLMAGAFVPEAVFDEMLERSVAAEKERIWAAYRERNSPPPFRVVSKAELPAGG